MRLVHGLDASGQSGELRQLAHDEAVGNPAFDLTPARFVTAIITELGPCPATSEGLRGLYPGARHS